MYRFLVCIALFCLQIYFVPRAGHLGPYLHPVALLLVSISIPFYYCRLLLADHKIREAKHEFNSKLTGAGLGVLSIGLCFFAFRSVIMATPDPSGESDVFPQLISQYRAFSNGQFPYFALQEFSWHPYPVYMPLHWLPIGLGDLLQLDPRWVGYIFVLIVTGVWGYQLGKNKAPSPIGIVAILLPALVFFCSIQLNSGDFARTFETVIAAYYLLLAIGLAQKNLALTVIGIICCLLSRYTLAFWLPLFFILLWFNTSVKNNFITWLSILLSVVLIYVLPFYIKDPSIFIKGINYHNTAVLGEWKGYEAVPKVSYTFDYGINFARYYYEFFPGTVEHKVWLARIIQGSCMLMLFFGGLSFYKRWRGRVSFYDLSLVMLYLFLLFFFMFGPLTYQYYYMPLLMISAVICGKAILLEKREEQVPA